MAKKADRPDAPWLCFVCGLSLQGIDEAPWGPDGDSPTYNFCPCCGVEFGYGDFSMDAVHSWRRRWREAGLVWADPALRPPDWDAERQLAALPERAK